MDSLADRVKREQALYDEGTVRAGQKKLGDILVHVNQGPSRWQRDKVIHSLVKRSLNGRTLEIGSQAWDAVFCRDRMQPADLVCINISQAELDHGIRHAEARGFHANFTLMDAHQLEFPDGSFDLVYGVAILHHLDFEKAMKEIWRVLKPGGQIMFLEPLRMNPVAGVVRLLTPSARTVDERPLGFSELRLIERYFETRSHYSDLLTIPAGVLSRFLSRRPNNPLMRLAEACDRALLRVLPSSGTIYRSVTVIGRKRENPK